MSAQKSHWPMTIAVTSLPNVSLVFIIAMDKEEINESFLPFAAIAAVVFVLFAFRFAWEALTTTSTSKSIPIIMVCIFESMFAALQLIYCILYKIVGIRDAAGSITRSAKDALYFSIITWTTTGYGDFAPFGWGRWVACSEALLGTLFNGVVLASVIYHLNLRAQQSRE